MSTPVEQSPFGKPGDLPPVTFGGGGHQTYKGPDLNGLFPATVKKIEACVGTFEGKQTPQYVLLFEVEGHEGQGELALYVSRKLSTHPKAKLVPTLTALKLALPTPENPQLPNPVGAKARLLVKSEARRDGQGTVVKIKDILAY